MARMAWSKRLEMTFGLCALAGLALLFGRASFMPLCTRRYEPRNASFCWWA